MKPSPKLQPLTLSQIRGSNITLRGLSAYPSETRIARDILVKSCSQNHEVGSTARLAHSSTTFIKTTGYSRGFDKRRGQGGTPRTARDGQRGSKMARGGLHGQKRSTRPERPMTVPNTPWTPQERQERPETTRTDGQNCIFCSFLNSDKSAHLYGHIWSEIS